MADDSSVSSMGTDLSSQTHPDYPISSNSRSSESDPGVVTSPYDETNDDSGDTVDGRGPTYLYVSSSHQGYTLHSHSEDYAAAISCTAELCDDSNIEPVDSPSPTRSSLSDSSLHSISLSAPEEVTYYDTSRRQSPTSPGPSIYSDTPLHTATSDRDNLTPPGTSHDDGSSGTSDASTSYADKRRQVLEGMARSGHIKSSHSEFPSTSAPTQSDDTYSVSSTSSRPKLSKMYSSAADRVTSFISSRIETSRRQDGSRSGSSCSSSEEESTADFYKRQISKRFSSVYTSTAAKLSSVSNLSIPLSTHNSTATAASPLPGSSTYNHPSTFLSGLKAATSRARFSSKPSFSYSRSAASGSAALPSFPSASETEYRPYDIIPNGPAARTAAGRGARKFGF